MEAGISEKAKEAYLGIKGSVTGMIQAAIPHLLGDQAKAVANQH